MSVVLTVPKSRIEFLPLEQGATACEEQLNHALSEIASQGGKILSVSTSVGPIVMTATILYEQTLAAESNTNVKMVVS